MSDRPPNLSSNYLNIERQTEICPSTIARQNRNTQSQTQTQTSAITKTF
jgi:hypothetical protein